MNFTDLNPYLDAQVVSAGDVAAAGDDPRGGGVKGLVAVLPCASAFGGFCLAPAGRSCAALGLGRHGAGRSGRGLGQPQT